MTVLEHTAIPRPRLIRLQTGHDLAERLVSQSAPGAKIPAQRTAGAHLHQLRQVIRTNAQRVGRTGRDADAALHAAPGVDYRPFQFPEPDLAGRLVDVIHRVPDGERGRHITSGTSVAETPPTLPSSPSPGPTGEGGRGVR